ncbi:MAG: pyridoxal-phosphate dependent enzyme [Spartobacteria bacterium]|nr:pyridoxal-phosphate dependent enzyme [Spartobacteria bacterium]
MIDHMNNDVLNRTITRAKEQKIILPTIAQQKDPSLISADIVEKLSGIGLWDIDPLNLFRITWKNEATESGGGFNNGNYIEFPSEITGVDAKIVGLSGKWFPTGAHKVGAAYGCLVPRLVSGNFDPTKQKAVWPSTGNYCRGGAYDCALLGCPAIAILPEEMSRERFDWLREIGTNEIFATPGCESNVKEIYDKCWELRKERGDDIVIFNQFDEFGNAIWHYQATGTAVQDLFTEMYAGTDCRLSAYVSATGSAGTIAAGDFLKTIHPRMRVIATEALQCPTLYQFGFGGHRIEGIGDKHVPWIHNVRNTDMIAAIDDEQVMQIMRLLNEEAGLAYLKNLGVKDDVLSRLEWLGISSICNLVAAIKAAKYYDMTSEDVIFLPMTDSMEMYGSRLTEMREMHGIYTETMAAAHYGRYLEGASIDYLRELNYQDRKALHNFKYFTWVEQQGKTVEELRALWSDDFWQEMFAQEQVDEWDQMINAFNTAVNA